jgi:hypothetical protein
MKNLFVEYGLQLVTSEDIGLFLNRLDRKKDGRITLLEFKDGLLPQQKYMNRY